MKIEFEDKSYIECRKNDDKILFVIVARDQNNKLKKLKNAVELTEDEFKRLISEI